MSAQMDIEGISKREIFIKKLSHELDHWMKNREFFNVIFRDFPPHESEQITKVMEKFRKTMINIHKEILFDTYGYKVSPYISDVVTILEGILKEYVFTIVFKRQFVNVRKLANLIAVSMDAIVQSLLDVEPVLDEQLFGEFDIEEELENRLSIIREKITKLNISNTEIEKIESSLQLIHDEIFKENPKVFLLEALIVYLKNESELEEDFELMERLLDRYVGED
ncbi:hypothetical protein [Tenuibacillus multivorans]|uniref:hypothetical protein n=1 Tax=Tenuibacillus multivorans TaxID=237069 RepID=UPI001FE10ABA|nr:hypothetical protein [Tenuibacillus multivorans]